MADSIRCKLEGYLTELQAGEFKRFKMHLEEYPLEEGYKRIPRYVIQEADSIDIASRMVRAYEEAKAVKMAINIFDKINRKDLSESARKEMPASLFLPPKPIPFSKEEKRKQEEKEVSDMVERFFGPKKKKVEVTLDPKTAFPTLLISEDRKSVHLGDRAQPLPDNPERFDFRPCVLGAEGISSGTLEWVVEVGDTKSWTIGAVRESAERKGSLYITVMEGFWVLELYDGKYEALTRPRTSLPLSKPLRRIAMLLEYDMGNLSFYDADSRDHVFTFNHLFSEKMFPFFQTWDTEIPLRLCPLDE
uniref:Uncharacterized protein n=1 Tax=Sphenodon punctatus TaxID=8508 RepID=A0A8D0GHJ3_SPHPU